MLENNTSFKAKWLIFIILFSSILVLSAIFIAVNKVNPSFLNLGQKEAGIYIKKVYTTIPSADGQSHSLAADFYITSSEKTITDTQAKQVQTAILEIIPTLDYDKMTAKDGTHYFIESIKKELKASPSNEWVNDIYISNLLLDVNISPAKNEEKGTTIEEMFEYY